MIYSLRNIRFPVASSYDLKHEIGKKLGLPTSEVELLSITRKAIDTRRKNQPFYDFTVTISNDLVHSDLSPFSDATDPQPESIPVTDPHPYIIGMGPAGLFCALAMVRNGLKPILFDQGESLAKRAATVQDYWSRGTLSEDSNVQFGEGGAGAFSDGKLTSRNRDLHIQQVYSALISFGAEPSISYDALPHLGTDGIRAVVGRIRDYLIDHGCSFHYSSKLTDIELEYDRLKSIRINSELHHPQLLVIATGNASRPTFRMLNKRGLAMESKAFSVGFRIEQSQALINRSIYGSEKWVSILGPATYRLTHKGAYTFCMCPGGYVIGAASEQGGVVCNGMSFAQRSSGFANSAVVSTVNPKDCGSNLFSGMEFQQQIEKSACQNTYLAPAQNAEDFIRGKQSGTLRNCSYLPGVYSGNLSTFFPKSLSDGLKSALLKFSSTIRDFTSDAVLIAPETRTSSPLRILRSPDRRNSISCRDIYPIGEGSGYAGGIISSAADGYSLGMRLKPE